MTDILLGVVLGAVLIGFVFFGVFLIQALKGVRESANRLSSSMEFLSQNQELIGSLKSFGLLAEVGQSLARKMDTINTTMEIFYKFAVAQPGMVGKTEVDSSSGTYAYDEQEAALREAQAKLRREAGLVAAEETPAKSEKSKTPPLDKSSF